MLRNRPDSKWTDGDVFTTQYGEVISYDPGGLKPIALPETAPSAERGRRLAKRVLERMKEFSGPGCHGLRWLKVGRNVYESLCAMAFEDRVSSTGPQHLSMNLLQGLPMKLDLEMEPDVVCYYG